MKILAGILMSLYLGLTLFGLYQYKAHDRKWGMMLVVWMSGLVLLVGVGIRFESGWLAVCFGVGFSLAYFVGWRLIGGRFAGWRQHLVRALAFAVCLGPLVAVRYSELTDFDEWLKVIRHTSFAKICRFTLYGIPGFFLVGAMSFLVSAGQEMWRKADGKLTAVVLSRWAKFGCGLLLPALLLCANWYVAGAFLYSSAERGQTRILQWVLWSRPGSVNANDLADGWTPLHEAAWWGQTETVKILLKARADVNAKPRYDVAPLHVAVARWANTETVKLLIDANAEVNAKDECGETPLHWGITKGHAELVKILLKAGADVNAKNEGGKTPLHSTAWKGRAGLAKLLLKAGAKVNARTEGGGTPLHEAAWWGQTELAKILLAAGAGVNARDNDGNTPFDMTRKTRTWLAPKNKERIECGELLRKHGAKTGAQLNAEAKQGKQE